MGDSSNIEWTDATWNPTTGCDKVSPGCDHCYAMTLAPRLKAMGSKHYQTDGDPATSGLGFGYAEHPDALDKPLRWTRPRKIFVNSMSDLFHQDATREFQAQVFAVMALAKRHTFQVLTKRPGVMRSTLSSEAFYEMVRSAVSDRRTDGSWVPTRLTWPIPNVQVGTSVEDQDRAFRVDALRHTPAAVRFLSCEPLLGPLTVDLTGIHWVIVGGESGPGARPMRADWARSLRDQCATARVPFHFKQWGSHDEHGTPMHKKVAGRVLDGRTWDEFPTGVVA